MIGIILHDEYVHQLIIGGPIKLPPTTIKILMHGGWDVEADDDYLGVYFDFLTDGQAEAGWHEYHEFDKVLHNLLGFSSTHILPKRLVDERRLEFEL